MFGQRNPYYPKKKSIAKLVFWAFYWAGSYDGSLLHFWVSLLKLLLLMLLFKYFIFRLCPSRNPIIRSSMIVLSPLLMSLQDASQNFSKASKKTKLPKVILPKFPRDPSEETTLWDSFSSAIHANHELNEIDKFQYLKS